MVEEPHSAPHTPDTTSTHNDSTKLRAVPTIVYCDCAARGPVLPPGWILAPVPLEPLDALPHHHHPEGSAINELIPETYEHLIKQGRRARAQAEYDTAHALFAAAITLSPERARAYCQRGAIEILQERWKDSLADYEQARRVEPDYPDLDSYFAEIYLYTGRYHEALELSVAAAEREPHNLMHTLNEAHSLLFLGQTESALEAYEALAPVQHVGKAKPMSAIIANDLRLMRASHIECEGMEQVDRLLERF